MRGIAKWPVACATLLAVAGLGWLGWTWGNEELTTRAEAGSSECEDHTTLRVNVAESIEEPLAAASAKWNEGERTVHAHCITVRLTAEDSERTQSALARTEITSGVPALWIPESTEYSDELAEESSDRITSEPESLTIAGDAAYPLVRISGAGVDEVQDRAAQKFSQFLRETEPRTEVTSNTSAG